MLPPLPAQLDPKRGARGSRARSRRGHGDLVFGALMGARIVAALLSLAILLGSGFAWASFRTFTSQIRRVNAIGGSSGGGVDGKDQNILIVGNDDRETASDAELKMLGTTRDGGSLNTDTMMLLHVPANGERATLISFPRDSYVKIPGFGMDRLNAAYADGVNSHNGDRTAGAQLLVKTIENLIQGLHIDHYAQIDLLGFYRISNAIGGIDVCLNNAMRPATSVGQVGPGFDSGYEPNGNFIYSYSGINLKKGANVIQGTQALAFVRQRHGLPRGDLDRIQRQQYFLSAVFRKMTSKGVLLNPLKQKALLTAVQKSITMDTGLDPLKLASQVQNLQAGNFTLTTIPNIPDQMIDGKSVIGIDTAVLPAWFARLTGVDPSTAVKKATAAPKNSFALKVLNGSGENGMATRNTEALKQAGFTQASVDTGDPGATASTTIRYAPGMESAAKAVLDAVPGATLDPDPSATVVTLIIGANKIQVKSLMPTKAPSTSTAKASSTPTPAPSGDTHTAADAGCIN